MKKIIVVFLITYASISAQIDIGGGMGINLSAASSLNDYINAFNQTNNVSTFNSNIEFFGEAGYYYSPNFLLGLDYSFSLYSYNNDYNGMGKYEIKYNMHSPTITAYYVIKGQGYRLKFGGGLGIRYLLLNETLPYSTVAKEYSTTGLGVLFKAEGNTAIGSNVYAIISFTLKLDYPGVPKNNGTSLSDNASNGSEVNINSVSGGVRLGVLYSF